jgi:hypothetical protein
MDYYDIKLCRQLMPWFVVAVGALLVIACL